MEIATSPHRPASTPWGRLVALVVIVAPVSVLALLPMGLGLERYVMSSDTMDGGSGGIARGTVLLERQVPVSDLHVGDVITFRTPASSDADRMVTHRIVSTGPAGIVTQGDAEPARDPWVLRPETSTLPRVELTVPVVGYAYLWLFQPRTWALVMISVLVLALVVATELSRRLRPPGHSSEAPAEDAGGGSTRQAAALRPATSLGGSAGTHGGQE